MKNLLVIPLVLISFCVIADERITLATFEYETTESGQFGLTAESTLSGFGARFYNFRDVGFYWGATFVQRTGDFEVCVLSDCSTGDETVTVFSGEFGRDLGGWTSFVGASFTSSETEFMSSTASDETWGLYAGLWLDFEDYKLRGTMTDLDNADNRAVHGGLLFQMDNNFALGAEIGFFLERDVDAFKISLQFGRVF